MTHSTHSCVFNNSYKLTNGVAFNFGWLAAPPPPPGPLSIKQPGALERSRIVPPREISGASQLIFYNIKNIHLGSIHFG